MQEFHLTDQEQRIISFDECAEASRRAVSTSRCNNPADFLAAPNHSQAVKTIIVCDYERQSSPHDIHILQNVVTWGEDGLCFWIADIDGRKETYWVPGGLVRFLHAVQASSCSSLMLCDVVLGSPFDTIAWTRTPSLRRSLHHTFDTIAWTPTSLRRSVSSLISSDDDACEDEDVSSPIASNVSSPCRTHIPASTPSLLRDEDVSSPIASNVSSPCHTHITASTPSILHNEDVSSPCHTIASNVSSSCHTDIIAFTPSLLHNEDVSSPCHTIASSCHTDIIAFTPSLLHNEDVSSPCHTIASNVSSSCHTDIMAFTPSLLHNEDVSSPCHTVASTPSLLHIDEDVSSLCHTIASTPSLHTLHLEAILGLEADLKLQIGEALLQSSSLQSLSLDTSLCSTQHLSSLLSLKDKGIKFLSLIFRPASSYTSNTQVPAFDLQAIITLLTENTTALTTLQIAGDRHGGGDSALTENLGTMLLSNTSLTSLNLYNLQLPEKAFRALFNSLEYNSSLTSLSLRGCSGKGWLTGPILDCLLVNASLGVIDLIGTPLEDSAAIIQSQLQRNLAIVERMKYHSTRIRPTGIRLFLCGLPFSGKTTLCRSLAKLASSKSYPGYKYLKPVIKPFTRNAMLERTHGIEVTSLEKDGLKLSLWDLAGQIEYYAFHDQMFPNFSDRACPALFLFVWNPFELDAETGKIRKFPSGELMRKTHEKFETELKYWLKFLASKTLRSERYRPRLLIAVTRRDCDVIKNYSKILLKESVEKLQKQFFEFIQFDMDNLFLMDARDPSQVEELTFNVFECAKDILNRAPLVYQACEDARTVLASLVQNKNIAPMVRKETFHSLCKEHLQITSREIREALALSLNDSGDLIYLMSVELVVMDVKWFCHQLMGDFLHESMKSASADGLVSQGFFVVDVLEKLLADKANARSSSKARLCSPKIEGKDLVELLKGLQLACSIDTQHIFIPLMLSSRTRGIKYTLEYFKGAMENIYIGRRLRCKDSIHTCFTPNLFPLLQVELQSFFKDLEVHVTLEENAILFSYEGVLVLIEACGKEGEEQCIDILLCSPQDLDGTIEWMHENVLNKVQRICAKPKAIQGVQLVYEVIRPYCVGRAFSSRVSSDERRQVVSLEKLKVALEKHLERKGYQHKLEDITQNVKYTWQPTAEWDYVAELLGGRESLQVIERYVDGLDADAEDALCINSEWSDFWSINSGRQGTELEIIALEEVENVCATDQTSMCGLSKNFAQAALGADVEQEGTSSSRPHMLVSHNPIPVEERETIEGQIIELRKDVQKLGDGIQKLGARIEKRIDNVRNTVQKRLGQLLMFAEEGEAGKLPRMYVVIRDDGHILCKMAATVVPGLHSMRLCLLCEHKSRPHLVDGKQGLPLATLDDGLLKKALPYVNAFLKVAHVAVKVGAHVAAGSGSSIPDFTHVLALIQDTDAIPSIPTISEPMGEPPSRGSYQEGLQWLHNVLSRYDCLMSSRIHEVFGLNQVRDRKTKAVSWLCDAHSPLM